MRKKFKKKTFAGKAASVQRKTKRDSEFQSYTYIKNELRALEWNVSNPNRDPSGQLYTQQECLGHPEIKMMLDKLTPEYVLKLREDAFWVIEAKPTHEQIDQAYGEAKGYSELINKHPVIRAMIVSGVAGNDIDKYLIKSGFWDEKKKVFTPITYNDREITSLVSPKLAERLLDQKSASLKDLEFREEEYINVAEKINKVFHSASIKKDTRAGIVASILLSLLGDTEPNYNASPNIFVKDINSRAHEILTQNSRGDFSKYIRIHLPQRSDAKRKFKEALVSAFFLLRKVNIKSAMRAGSDILGKFYEGFLKYGNGAKDLGILLTPSHITEFASEVLNITHRDIVYDPTCGTGGFLVSAFYHVKKNANPVQLNGFKQHSIFGVDQQPTITALAIVNMIFRGDGKNNIINENCLASALVPDTIEGRSSAKFVTAAEGRNHAQRPVSKVLMNPPFALKKESEKEYKFVDHALEQMEDGGLLFSILPVSVMIKMGKTRKWRENLLKTNTLLSVITFPIDLFYQAGASQPTIGILLKKGAPYTKGHNVFWIRAIRDGLVKKKGKRISNPKVPNDLLRVKPILQSFIQNPATKVENIPELQKACPIDFSDKFLELVPEAYLDSKVLNPHKIEEGMEDLIRQSVAYIIKSKREVAFADQNR
jgi:type I restriction-modification system DNA methylase subunit